MNETAHFVNEGFGWECKRCRGRAGERAGRADEGSSSSIARFFREGEAEGGAPRLSTTSLARWKDDTRTSLRCPACGVEEEFKG